MKGYEDIIEEKWPRESKRPRMPLGQRAKIFLPFSALVGYDEALQETLKAEVESMKSKTGGIKFEDIFPALEP
ncbi:MAG: hypothetical protein K6A42_01115 [Treponema sp.]|nr:hypothetical protein [Treponema sp.]